tara:strand:+ start:251 stop:454 length:204 start_codon:yes stop_codon:yes gene_type:complete
MNSALVLNIILLVAIFIVITACFAITASLYYEVRNRIIRRRERKQERELLKEKCPTCGKPIEEVKNV